MTQPQEPQPEETSDATREALDIWREPWPGDDES